MRGNGTVSPPYGRCAGFSPGKPITRRGASALEARTLKAVVGNPGLNSIQLANKSMLAKRIVDKCLAELHKRSKIRMDEKGQFFPV